MSVRKPQESSECETMPASDIDNAEEPEAAALPPPTFDAVSVP